MSYYRRTRAKRQRFTVTLDDGNRYVVLAYTAEGARNYYSRSVTRTVVGVTRGDYRVRERNASLVARGGYTLDQEAVEDAKSLLGLKLRVTIRFNSRVGSTNANHRLRAEGGSFYHDVMLKSYLTAEKATESLWHELTHAMQAERAMAEGKVWDDVTRAQRRWSYSVRPIEVEARAMAKQMADLALCRAV